jgi:hypothetical protein
MLKSVQASSTNSNQCALKGSWINDVREFEEVLIISETSIYCTESLTG